MGDHPFIRHPSCIPFRRAKLEPLTRLEEARGKGATTVREPLAPEILQPIQQAALTDIHPPRNFKLAIRETLRNRGAAPPAPPAPPR